ncbi:MAG: SusC/RagA family TonB-linked outer membrane protein [Bacteroides sp.]|nr:SusC/RagA family TonB-linked outer membrane protein [Bacteroides sp.]
MNGKKNKLLQFIQRSGTQLFLMIALCLAGSPVSVLAQSGTVTGTVQDDAGMPLPGVNIIVKNTQNGTIAGLDGDFTLAGVDLSKDVLIFSYIGFNPVEVPVNNRRVIDVVMKEDNTTLDEVVVIGYGSMEKKELSSSIVQVSRKDFMQGAVQNPMELITGKVAGFNVNNTAPANPNAGSSLQIRGATSLTASNSPLIVIDGIVGADIRNLSSQDIESMTVLKDGASSAIYGTRGANGVVIITTRKGAGGGGKAKVVYDGWFGMNLATFKPENLSTDEFRRSMRGYDYGGSTDWYKQIMRDLSYDTNHYVAIDGSSQDGYYSASFNYKKATGMDIASEREEYGARFVVSQGFMDNFMELTGSLYARKVEEKWGDDGQFFNALSINPTMPVYNEDGSFFHPTSPTGALNPVEQLTDRVSGGNRVYLLGNVEAKLNLLKTDHHILNTALSYSQQYNDLNQHEFIPSTHAESIWNNYDGRATLQYQKWWYSQVEWITNYTFSRDDHLLRFMGGYSFREDNWESRWMENKDFPYDSLLWHNITTGSFLNKGEAGMSTGKTQSRLIGVFGRLNYNWNDLIMASASLRYEGSTKFGPKSRWGYFPAASLAWEIANMPFMESVQATVNSLKPRISYGVTGRSDFDAYRSLATYSSQGLYLMNGNWINGFGPSKNPNPSLSWEKGINTNIGIDFELWRRVRGSLDYFDRRSKDLLYTYTAPQPPMIYSDILVNVGTTINTGIELSLEADLIRSKDLHWTSGVVYSTGSTKLDKLSDDVYQASYLQLYRKPGEGTTEYLFRVEEGGKVGNFYGYKHAGVDEEGYLLIYDKEGNKIRKGSESEEDKRYIGNGAPKHFLSWNNSITYKNFDLSIFFRGAFGYDIMNMLKYGMGTMATGNANVLRTAYTDYAHITKDTGILSSFYLENGNYFKLENVTLGYTIPFRGKGENRFIEKIRVFGSARNVFTLTKYKGGDPSTVGVNGLEPGVGSGSAYPSTTQLSVGLTVNFK